MTTCCCKLELWKYFDNNLMSPKIFQLDYPLGFPVDVEDSSKKLCLKEPARAGFFMAYDCWLQQLTDPLDQWGPSLVGSGPMRVENTWSHLEWRLAIAGCDLTGNVELQLRARVGGTTQQPVRRFLSVFLEISYFFFLFYCIKINDPDGSNGMVQGCFSF